jgi:hypothetical protein
MQAEPSDMLIESGPHMAQLLVARRCHDAGSNTSILTFDDEIN